MLFSAKDNDLRRVSSENSMGRRLSLQNHQSINLKRDDVVDHMIDILISPESYDFKFCQFNKGQGEGFELIDAKVDVHQIRQIS